MTREEVHSRVFKVIAEELGGIQEDLDEENDLKMDLGIDSLEEVELLMAIEQEFDIEIPDVEAEKITTVEEIIDKVMAKLS